MGGSVERSYPCRWCGQTYATARTFMDHGCVVLQVKAFPLFWQQERQRFGRFADTDPAEVEAAVAAGMAALSAAYQRFRDALLGWWDALCAAFARLGEALRGCGLLPPSPSALPAYAFADPPNVGYHAMVRRRALRSRPSPRRRKPGHRVRGVRTR